MQVFGIEDASVMVGMSWVTLLFWSMDIPSLSQHILVIYFTIALQRRSPSENPGEAVNKSAASAASLDGFSSRDQVGC